MSTGPSSDIEVQSYIHCGRCAKEWNAKAPGTEGTTPGEYSRLSVGWTPKGLQVICQRHQCNVLNIDFEGHKHPANLNAKLDA
jgi:hypothetical protein